MSLLRAGGYAFPKGSSSFWWNPGTKVVAQNAFFGGDDLPAISASLLSGVASGTITSTRAGATLPVSASLLSGVASGSTTQTGATLPVSASLLSGVASQSLVLGKQVVSYSGQATEYTILQNGTVTVKAWGGAGGGGGNSKSGSRTSQSGGAGGLVRFDLTVQVGDILRVEVGRGGRGARQDGTGNAGLGGWPDGGDAGWSIAFYTVSGAGGGSTRIYLNNVLTGVAGAGGGGAGSNRINETSSVARTDGGGAGGGLIGQHVVEILTPFSIVSEGGNQSSGGLCLTSDNAPRNGSALSGGDGFTSGYSRVRNDNLANQPTGAGGGGGWFGGAAGGWQAQAAQQNSTPGAGGSSYTRTSVLVTNVTHTRGNLTLAPGTTDVDYAAGIAVGQGPASFGAGTTGLQGGDGRVVLDFTDEEVPSPGDANGQGLEFVFLTSPNATASGALNLTALAGPLEVPIFGVSGTGSVPIEVSGQAFPAVSITSAVEGSALATVFATGSLPTLNIFANIISGPVAEANVVLDLAGVLSPYPFTEMLITASSTGAADTGTLILDQITVFSVLGFYFSDDAVASADISATVSLVPVEGFAVQPQVEAPLLTFMTSSVLIEASIEGAAVATGRLSVIPQNNLGGGVTLGAPFGFPSSADMNVSGDLPKIIVEEVLGVGLAGDGVVLAVGQEFVQPIRTEVTNTNAVQASGQGQAVSQQNGTGNNPGLRFLVRCRLSGIGGSATGIAQIEVSFDLTIVFATPIALTQRGLNLAVPIGTVFVRRQLGGAGDNPSFEGDALAGLDLRDTPIVVTPVGARGDVDGEATGQGQLTVQTFPPFTAFIGQGFPVGLPGPVDITPVDGEAYPLDPASTALGDLSVVITLSSAQGSARSIVPPLPPGPAPCAVVFVRVENATVVLEDVIQKTVVMRE